MMKSNEEPLTDPMPGSLDSIDEVIDLIDCVPNSPGLGVTKEVDPDGIDAHEPGSKLDSGKPDASLLGDFGKALLAVAEVGTYGAAKYSRSGWISVADGINRYTAAMLRHHLEEGYNEMDSDLPVMHCAQVAWNALARLELILREKEEDDIRTER